MTSISNQPRNRRNERPSNGGGNKRRPPMRHQAHCASCGAPTTLPFKPTEQRPGFCAVCFKKRAPVAADRAPRSLRPERSDRRDDVDSHPDVFAGLPIRPRTRAALARMNITTPTPIQEQAIPWLSEGNDLIGQAMTGSGKTLAFGIPLVEKCSPSAPGVQGLVLVPTRELAIQVATVLEAVADDRVSIAMLYGGHALGGEKRTLQKGAQIIVGTPGRTLDHIRQGNLRLGNLRMLVLDEADEMLDQGFARDVEAIIGESPSTRQTALFSATVPEWVATTSKDQMREPKSVSVAVDETNSLKIEHSIYMIEKQLKMQALRTLLDDRGNAPIIVFGRTKHGVKKLADQLTDLGYPVGALQGNLSQNARERVMVDFRSGTTPILVATNVAARGLDVEGIAQVINFDLPDSIQLFTHRVGRTGRMGKAGEAITFVSPDEEKKWREIERGFETAFEVKRWGNHGPQELIRNQRDRAPRSQSRPSQSAPRRDERPAPRSEARSSQPAQRTERRDDRSAPRHEARTSQPEQRTERRDDRPTPRQRTNDSRGQRPAPRQARGDDRRAGPSQSRDNARPTQRREHTERSVERAPRTETEAQPAQPSEPRPGQTRILWNRSKDSR